MIHGDKMSEARTSDSSDYSVDQFLRVDDGREATDDSHVHTSEFSNEPKFDSEDTPDYDSFAQVNAKKAVKKGYEDDDGDGMIHGDKMSEARTSDSSDYSVDQFLRVDDGREATADPGTKSSEFSNEPKFDSEDTPDYDSFAQLKAKKASK